MTFRKLFLLVLPWLLLYAIAWGALFNWVVPPSLPWVLVMILLEFVVGLVWLLVFVLSRFPRWPG